MAENLKQFEDQINQAKGVIKKLEDKDFSLYFFTLDTKGNPTAGIANIYEHVKLLNELQRDRRDERLERDELRRELEMNNKAKIERDELRKELETNKANIDKLDRLYKYCSETQRKTINKEVIINIIKGVNI
jgi:hypothetical protein